MSQFYSLPLSVQEIMAKSREVSGIDIVDEEAIEPLTVLHDATNKEARLFEQGAIDIQNFTLRSLINRLRMKRDFKAHPEIADQVIKAPVFICGGTRTGSTKTQKLLAATGDFNWLPYWQSLNPALATGDRDESPAPRIKDTDELIDWYDRVAPDMKLTHALHTFEPEEESFLLAHSLRTPVLTGMVDAPSYIQWLMTQDMSLQFKFLRDNLKYLQWQGLHDPEKCWLLKSPFYAGLEPILLSVFPDAQLVMTHRNPIETMPSTCSLFTSYRRPYSDVKIDAKGVVAGAAIPMNLHLDIRANYPEIEFLDIHYKELVKSVETVVEKIYAFCNMTLSEEARQRVVDWDKKNPKHIKGVHKYSLEEFGLTEEMVTQPYARYMAFLNERFGRQ